MNSLIGDSGRELLKVNGFGDGEIDEYLRMVDDGEVELQSARWLKQHRAAKKFETDFRKKNNFDGRIVFTNSDGIDLLSPETFREHPNSRGLQTVEQMLSARMLDDMAPNMKKTLKAIKKSPDAQARIRSAQIGQNKKPNVDVSNAGSRINSIEDNEVDDIFNSLTDDLRNIANGIDVEDRGMRSITGSNDSNAARESRRLTGTNFDEMSDEELDKIINEGDTSQIGGNRDIYFFGAVEERNRRKGIKPFNSNDFDFDISRFSNSSRPTSRRNSRQSPPDNRLLDNESGTRSRPVPKTFNDYVENPPRQGMRSQSGPKPPQYPRKPTMGAFIGSADSEFDGITNWEDFKRVLADKEIVFIDYETTGLKFNEFNE
jgi:hypothetical protein